MADSLRLGIEIEASGAAETARAVGAIQDELDGVQFDGSSFKGAQEAIAATTRQLQELAETFEFDGAAPMNLPTVSKQLAELRANVNTTTEDLESLRESSGLTAEEFAALNDALGRIEKRNTDSLARLASTLKTNIGGAREFADALGLTADEASTAYSRMQQLASAGATQSETFVALSRELGITADQYQRLAQISEKSKLAAQTDSIARLAATLGTNLAGAEKFVVTLGMTADESSQLISRIKQLSSAGATQDEIFAALSRELSLTADQYQQLAAAAARSGQASDQAGDVLSEAGGGAAQGFGAAFSAVTSVAFGLNEVVAAGQMVLSTLGPAYELLIGSNEKLNQQLLASQSNIAATADIRLNGVDVTDPTAKIQASEGALREALKDLEIQTQDLVGVTDADVQGVFQILLQNTSALTGQSKVFGDSIQSATNLTTGLVATMGTLGVPIDQASSEVGDLIKGQITSDSIIGKSLGINNEMVQTWKSQGTLVDELNKRFETFKAGNALAANSIAGVTSNIQSAFEDIGRQVGEDLLLPLVDSLKVVMNFLNDNKQAFIDFGQEVVDYVGSIAVRIGEIAEDIGGRWLEMFAPIQEIAQGQIAPTLEYVGKYVEQMILQFEAIGEALLSIGQVIMPIIQGQIKAATAVFGGLLDGASKITPIVTKGMQGLAEVLGLVANVLAPITQKIGEFIALVGGALGGALSLVGTGVERIYNNAEGFFGRMPNLLRGGKSAIQESQEAVEAYSNSFDLLSTEAGKRLGDLEGAIAARTAAEKAGIDITQAQADAERKAVAQAGLTLDALKAQRQELEDAAITGVENREAIEGQKAALDEQIGALETNIELLGESTGELEINAKAAQDLGTAIEQLARKADGALDKLLSGTGTSEELEEAAKTLIETGEQQLELGQITADEYAKNLESIANNTTLSAEQQLAAEEKLTELKEKELDKRLQAFQNSQAELERDIAAGRVDEIEGEEQLTASKLEAIEVEREARQKSLDELEKDGRGDSAQADEIRQQLTELAGDAEEIAFESAQKISEMRLQKLEEEQDKARQILEKSQIDQQNALKRLQLEGRAGESEARELELQQEEKRLNDELSLNKKANRERLKERKSLLEEELKLASSPEEEAEIRKKFDKETEQAKRDQAIETAQLEGDLLDNQISKEEAARDKIRELIDLQVQTATIGIEKQIAAGEELERSLNRQTELIQAQNDLFVAQNALAQDIAQNRVDGFDRALGTQRELAGLEDAQKNANRAKLEAEIAMAKEGSSQRLALEKQLATVTGERSRLIQQQLAETEEGSAKRARLEKELEKAIADESKAQAKEAADEAKKQAEIAAAEEKQRREELAGLGLDANATELDIIKAKQAAEDELARKKLEALQNEQRQQQIALELDIQRNKLAAERNLLQARAAALSAQQNQAEAELALAKDPNNELLKAQIDLAKQGVELANQGAANAEEDLNNQTESAQNQRELLALQQQAALEQAKQDEQFRQMDQARELAAQGLMDATRLATQGDISLQDFALPTAAGTVGQVGTSITEPIPTKLEGIPPLTIDPDNPMNQNLEGLRGDFQQLAAVLANAMGQNTTINVGNNRGGADNPNVGKVMVSGAGL